MYTNVITMFKCQIPVKNPLEFLVFKFSSRNRLNHIEMFHMRNDREILTCKIYGFQTRIRNLMNST